MYKLKEKRERSTFDILLEKIPPIIGYSMIIFPVVGSFFVPNIVGMYLIIIFVFFFYKSSSTAFQFALGLWKIREGELINWKELVDGLETPKDALKRLKNDQQKIRELSFRKAKEDDLKDGKDDLAIQLKKKSLPDFYRRILFWFQKKKTLRFFKQRIKTIENLDVDKAIKPSELQHIIIVPYVNEPIELLNQTLECLQNQTFSTKQINVVLAAEARVDKSVETANKLKKRYEKYFNNVWVTEHDLQYPDTIGKSANMNWAAREVHKIVTDKGWDLEKTTITSCDSDSKIDAQYYSYVSYKYITQENAKYKIYTAGLVFYNNIWRLPFYARVKNSFSSIYNVSKLVRTDRLIPVSTYTTSFWMIEKINFWTPWITPEDYHIFFKALFTFDNKVSTVPIFLRTMSDAAEGDGHLDTMKNNYMQSRRWAWGMSDNGWMLKEFFRSFFRLSLISKYKVLHALFDHVTGANLAILILLGGNLPVILNPDFSQEVFGTLLPTVTSTIVRLTLVFLIFIIVLDSFLRPKPMDNRLWKRAIYLIEWVVQPVSGFFLAALPGIDSQTRLLFGQYMEYYVTKKKDGTDTEEAVV